MRSTIPGMRGQAVFPPALAPAIRALAAAHGYPVSLGNAELEELLTTTFLASLRTEEQEHHPVRIALMETPFAALHQDDASPRLYRFAVPVPFSAKQLVRLARAAPSERLFVAVAPQNGLAIIG